MLTARDAGVRPVPASGSPVVPSCDVGFDKYTLCGNTFLIVDETRTPLRDDVERSQFARWSLDEHFGVGGTNNVIYLTRLSDPGDATYAFRIFEQDGSETLSCGNGLLCAAALFGRGGPAAGPCGPAGEWRVLTELPTGRPKPVRVGTRADGCGTWVDVGPPRRTPPDLFRRPTVADDDLDGTYLDAVDIEVKLPIGGADDGLKPAIVGLSGWLVFTGEPHLVLVLGHGLPLTLRERFFPHRDRISSGPLTLAVLDSNELMDCLGVAVNARHAARFPRGVHVNVVDVLDGGGLLRYRTWERAIDQETLACGSGALACAHVCRVRGLITARQSTLLPYRCRCHKPDAFLRVTDNPGGLVLEGDPMLVCSGVVPSGAATHQDHYPAGRTPRCHD